MNEDNFQGLVSQQYKGVDIVDAANRVKAQNQANQANQGLMQVPEASKNNVKSLFNDMAKAQEAKRQNALIENRLQAQVAGLGGSVAVPAVSPELSGDMSKFFNKLSYHESRHSDTAQNKSGAYGRFQIMPGTQKEAAGELGITVDQARSPVGQKQVIKHITDKSVRALKNAGFPVTDQNLWTLHNQGRTGGLRILMNKDNISRKNIAANLPANIEPTAANYRKYWSKFDTYE